MEWATSVQSLSRKQHHNRAVPSPGFLFEEFQHWTDMKHWHKHQMQTSTTTLPTCCATVNTTGILWTEQILGCSQSTLILTTCVNKPAQTTNLLVAWLIQASHFTIQDKYASSLPESYASPQTHHVLLYFHLPEPSGNGSIQYSCNMLVHCIHFHNFAGFQKALENEKSSTCLNQDKTLHTNGTARVLQVSKTLDLFFFIF